MADVSISVRLVLLVANSKHSLIYEIAGPSQSSFSPSCGPMGPIIRKGGELVGPLFQLVSNSLEFKLLMCEPDPEFESQLSESTATELIGLLVSTMGQFGV